MIKRLFCLTLLAASIAMRSFAQTNDQVTYDIVYDVSGSIPIFDNNGNLLSLLQQMIRTTGNSKSKTQKINSYADFRLYFIGEKADGILKGEKFLTIKANDPVQTKTILDAIDGQILGSRTQKRTHLHTALDEILKSRDDAKFNKTAGGVFIFSDAQIGENDFEVNPGDPERKDLQSYQKMINLRIAQIQTQMHKPVFLVQSYQLPQNDLAMIPDSAKYPNANKEIISTGNWFWLRNSLVVKSDPNVQKEFQRFIDEANITIVNFNRPIRVDDKVAAAIKIEQIFELLRNVQSVDIAELIKDGKPTTMQPQIDALQQIAALAHEREFSAVQIQQIQSAIELLSKAPQALRDLGAVVSRKLDTQLSLISDQSLNAASFPAIKANVAPVRNAQAESMQAMILNGIAKYLVERVKQEIALYFIEQVNKRSINNVDRYQEIGEFLLPNTKTIIRNPENYTDINSLRTALLKDIDQLPDNLAIHADLFGRSEGLVTLSYFYQLYQNIRQSNSLELSFEKLGKTIEEKIKTAPTLVNSGDDGLDRKISAMEQSILFTSRLVGYLRSHDLSKIFIDQQPDTLTKLISLLSLDAKFVSNIRDVEKLRPVLNNIYLKYQDLKSTTTKYEPLFEARRVTSKVNEFNTDQLLAVNDLLTKISDLMLSGSDILKLIQIDPKVVLARFIAPLQTRIKKQQLTPVKLHQTYNFCFENTGKTVYADITDPTGVHKITTLKFTSDELQQVNIGGIDYRIHLLNYDKIVKTGAEIAFEIEELKNKFNTDFTTQAVIRSAQNTMQAYFLFRQQKYADGVNLIIPEIKTALRDRIGSDTVVLEHIEKILRIAGGVVNATSSDDIEHIIAQNAVAAGGYRNKRVSQKTFYLNAYAGGSFTAYSGDNRYAGALFAPVGFELAWGNQRRKKGLHSFGAMLSIIDVGNIINYQLANNGADQTNVTSLSRAFAPGIYATYGLSNHHPISLLLGYQVNPARFNLGVAFDLPIIPFMQQK